MFQTYFDFLINFYGSEFFKTKIKSMLSVKAFDSIFKPQDSFDFNKRPSKGFRISLDLNSDVKRGLKTDKIVEC